MARGSSTTRCCCLISDSGTLFRCAWWVTRVLFSHLTIPLSLHALSPHSPQLLHHYYSKSLRDEQGRNALQYQKAFLSRRIFLESSLESRAFGSLLCRVSEQPHSLSNLRLSGHFRDMQTGASSHVNGLTQLRALKHQWRAQIVRLNCTYDMKTHASLEAQPLSVLHCSRSWARINFCIRLTWFLFAFFKSLIKGSDAVLSLTHGTFSFLSF